MVRARRPSQVILSVRIHLLIQSRWKHALQPMTLGSWQCTLCELSVNMSSIPARLKFASYAMIYIAHLNPIELDVNLSLFGPQLGGGVGDPVD